MNIIQQYDRLIHRLSAQIDRILRINQMDKITVEVGSFCHFLLKIFVI